MVKKSRKLTMNEVSFPRSPSSVRENISVMMTDALSFIFMGQMKSADSVPGQKIISQ